MENLRKIISDLGISKVKLSKYLGVSRQMIYNYLSFESIEEWPFEKRVLLMQLLNVSDLSDNELESIKVDQDYIMSVESKLSETIKNNEELDNFFNVNGLSKPSKTLLMETISLLKEMLIDDKRGKNFETIKYLHYFLQSIENVPENQYILAYMAKTNCFIPHDVFVFDENKQFILEGILFSALNLYNSGGASRGKIAESRKRFVNEIERKNEEKMGRTQKLKAINAQALKELGYSDMSSINGAEYIEKVAEIEARKGILND
ncbi:MAG: hypothetical protein R3Y13_00130 [bacterium]